MKKTDRAINVIFALSLFFFICQINISFAQEKTVEDQDDLEMLDELSGEEDFPDLVSVDDLEMMDELRFRLNTEVECLIAEPTKIRAYLEAIPKPVETLQPSAFDSQDTEIFEYSALDTQGVEIKDEIEAHSLREAISKIRNMGYFPINVRRAADNTLLRGYRMKNILGKIVTLVIVLAIGYWIVSGIVSTRRTETVKQESKDEKQLQTEKSLADMITKHNAVTDWRHGFKDSTLIEPAYTIEVEDALIRTDDRPIIFFAAVEDVVKEENKYSVYFNNKFDFLLGANIHFVLDCTPNQVNEIMLGPRSLFESNYAVIAKVSNIEKCIVRITTEDNRRVVLGSPIVTSNVFIASGRCLDLLFVGDYKTANFPEAEPK